MSAAARMHSNNELFCSLRLFFAAIIEDAAKQAQAATSSKSRTIQLLISPVAADKITAKAQTAPIRHKILFFFINTHTPYNLL